MTSISMRGNLTVPLDALRLLWSLEDHGFVLTVDGDTLLLVAYTPEVVG